MNSPRTFPSNNFLGSRSRGFTLVEMMTAVAVLSIMMVMLGQLLQLASQAFVNGVRNINNFTKARAMLDMFTKDVQSGVFRSDLPAFPSTSTGPAFYTERPGVLTGAGTERQVSLVEYDYSTDTSTSTSMSTLQRGDMAIAWGASPSTIPFSATDFSGNTVTPRDTAPGIVDYKVLYLYADGTRSTTYTSSTTNPLRAVGFTLVVVDDQTLRHLTTTQLQTLRSGFDTAATGTRSVKADWEDYLNNTLSWSSYPKTLGVGMKVFERYVPVTGF